VKGYTDLILRLNEKNKITLKYAYSDYDYERLNQPISSKLTESISRDYWSHTFGTLWENRLTEKHTLEFAISTERKRYIKPKLDGFGNIGDEARSDDEYEASIALKTLVGSKFYLKPKYAFIRNESNGSFYEYTANDIGLLAAWFPNDDWLLKTFIRNRWKDYDSQKNIHLDDRRDENFFGLFGIERKLFQHITLGFEYIFKNNASNDPSSRYTNNQIGTYIGYKF